MLFLGYQIVSLVAVLAICVVGSCLFSYLWVFCVVVLVEFEFGRAMLVCCSGCEWFLLLTEGQLFLGDGLVVSGLVFSWILWCVCFVVSIEGLCFVGCLLGVVV